MTVRECYEELGSDFDKVLSRLVSEALVKKFALKFLDDLWTVGDSTGR